MATPSYKGPNQPQAANSFWSGIGSRFGGGATPAYAGEGQPSSASSGFLGSSTPAYRSLPTGSGAHQRFAIVVPRELIPYQGPQQ